MQVPHYHFQSNIHIYRSIYECLVMWRKTRKYPTFCYLNDWFTANMVPYVSNYDQEHMVLILIVNLVYSQLYSYWQFDNGDSIYKR